MINEMILNNLDQHNDNVTFEKRFSEWEKIDAILEKSNINFNEDELEKGVLMSILNKENY